MSDTRILSTAGLCPANSIKLRSYCHLMKNQLTDKWLFADDFVKSHVCFVRDDFLNNINQQKLDLSQVIIVIGKTVGIQKDNKYHISLPLNAKKIKEVLNHISETTEFSTVNKSAPQSKKTLNIFKSSFKKIRKYIFNNNDRKKLVTKKHNKELFISNLSKKLNLNEPPPKKIVFLGSPASGKSTAIQSASSNKALSSDVSATDSVAQLKLNTTVGIDYAEISINQANESNKKLKLFGTPGQVKFNFVWDVIGKDADAFLILLDLSRPQPLSYLDFYIKFLKSEIGSSASVYCAFTHLDKYQDNITSLTSYIHNNYKRLSGVYNIDARSKKDTLNMLTTISQHLDGVPDTQINRDTLCNIMPIDMYKSQRNNIREVI